MIACWLSLFRAFMLRKSKASLLLHHGVCSKMLLEYFFFLRKNAAFSWMSLLLFNIWVFVLTGLGCYMPTCMHLCWQSYATYLHLCIYRSYVSKCSCGVALLLVIGITCMIFSCVCLWKSSTLYYIDYVGEELPLSAFCRTSVSEWEAFRSIDMDAEVCTCPASSVLFIIVHEII